MKKLLLEIGGYIFGFTYEKGYETGHVGIAHYLWIFRGKNGKRYRWYTKTKLT